MWRKCVGCLRVHHKHLKKLIETLGMQRPIHVHVNNDTYKQMQLCLQLDLCGYFSARTQWQTDSPDILSMWESTPTARLYCRKIWHRQHGRTSSSLFFLSYYLVDKIILWWAVYYYHLTSSKITLWGII